MVRQFIYFIFILLFFTSTKTLPQEKEKINLKRNELSDIKDEITKLEDQLNQKTEKEKESFNVLENYNKQNYLLRKLINRYKSEENKKQKEITESNNKISSLEKDISVLRKKLYKIYCIDL